MSIGSYKQIAPRVATGIQTQVVGKNKEKIILISETSLFPGGGRAYQGGLPGGGRAYQEGETIGPIRLGAADMFHS